MGKGAKWFAGLAVIGALIVGAWWLLQDRTDSAATRAATAPAAPGALPTAEAAPDLPTPTESADAKLLAAAPPATSVPLPASAGSTHFTGRLVDASGRAVAGAIVHYLPTSHGRDDLGISFGTGATPLDLARLVQARTGSDGRFSLSVSDLAPDHAPPANSDDAKRWKGSWEDVPNLLVLHPAFEARVVRCVGWRGGDFDAGDVVLVPGVALSGRAVDEQGRPLAGVAIAVPAFDDGADEDRRDEWWLVRATIHALTGDDGRFAFDGFWAGARRLDLRAPGRCLVQRSFTGEAGKPLDLGDIVLPRGGVIEGVVVDAQDRPVPSARVVARPAALTAGIEKIVGDVAEQFGARMGDDGNSIVDVETTADQLGAFRFDTLDPGHAPFMVYAGANGFEPVRVDNVALGGEPLRVRLAAIASIVLTVVDAESRAPVEGAIVEAKRLSNTFGLNSAPLAVTSDAAALKDAGVTPAPGVFLITPAGPIGNSAVVSAPNHATQSFDLPPVPTGERRELTVALARALRIAGHVLDPAHKPLAAAKVELRELDPEEGLTRTRYPPEEPRPDAWTTAGPDGDFAFEDLKADDWSVSASAPGFATGKLTVTLKAGAPVEDLALVLQPSGAIAGVVLRGGAPMAGAYVDALSVAQAEAIRAVDKAKGSHNLRLDHLARDVHHTQTDAQGRFRLDDLSAEPFELSGPPGVQLTVEVRAGETTEVTLKARAWPRVRGHVAGAPGASSAAAIYADLYLDLGHLSGWSTSSPEGHTDADGNFDVELAGPGRYRFRADLDKKHSKGVELNLDWDQDQWVELQLPSGN